MAEQARSDAARRAHRAVIGWLEEAFDEAAGAFKPGFSDATIATETGAAEEYVRKTREEFFGPLKEPTELAALRRDILQLGVGADQLIKDAEAAAALLRGQAKEMEERLDKLASANGWRKP